MKDKLEILLLDDEPIVLNRLSAAFKKVGYNVEIYGDAQEAIKKIHKKFFDIVITDIIMGDVNGMKVLKEVQKKSQNTKTIIITGYATADMAREAMDKGAFDIIAKPFQPNELISIIVKASDSIG